MTIEDILLSLFIFLAALLFSSVGHGGASGYLALMALLDVAPETMKPAALALNVPVAIITTIKFYRVGAFSWRLFWPLVLTSIPCAYIGGLLTLPNHIYKPLVGIILVYAAWRCFFSANLPAAPTRHPPLPVLLILGGLLGFLSGLVGVGGGIFLSPLLLLLRWAETRTVSGIVAAFILVNSLAGLLGVSHHGFTVAEALPFWIVAVIIGSLIGAEFGSKRLTNPTIRKVLALVLLIAGAKMVMMVYV